MPLREEVWYAVTTAGTNTIEVGNTTLWEMGNRCGTETGVL
jgi:hypothetical protein